MTISRLKFPGSKPRRFSTAEDLVKSFKFRADLSTDKISILHHVWDKEMGPFASHWALVGVKGGVLFVKPKSSAAAQELALRASGILRGLNKYFSRAWIKAIKPTYR